MILPVRAILAAGVLLLIEAGFAASPITFNGDGKMSLDGKPHFPVGLYVVEEPRYLPEKRSEMIARLDDVAKSPFRILIDYGNVFGPIEHRRSQILLADACAEKTTCDEAAIFFRIKQIGETRYVIAVNSSPEVRSGMLTLASLAKIAELMSGDGLAYIKDRSLLLTLDGYEGVVVKLD